MYRSFEFYVLENDIRDILTIINQNNAWIISCTGRKVEQEDLHDFQKEDVRQRLFKRDEFFIVNSNSKLKYEYMKYDSFFAYHPNKDERYVLDTMGCNSIGFLHIAFGYFDYDKQTSRSGYISYRPKLSDASLSIAQPDEYSHLYVRLKKQITQHMVKDKGQLINKYMYMGKQYYEKYKEGKLIPNWWDN